MLRKLDVLVFAISMMGWAIYLITIRKGVWAEDLSAVYIAAWFWANDHKDLIYSAPPGFFGGVSDAWRQAMDQIGLSEFRSFPYVYPPLWPALLAPATHALTPQGFSDLVLNLHIPMLVASIAIAGRLAKPDRMPWTVWGFIGLIILSFSTPAAHAVIHNQPSITVTFLVLLAMERLKSDSPFAAGVLLALAAAIKLAPALFVLVFLLDRNRRALAAFAASGALLALSSILIAGWQLHDDFLKFLHQMSGHSFFGLFNPTLGNALFSLDPEWESITAGFEGAPVVSVPAALTWALRFVATATVLGFGLRLWKLERGRAITIATAALGIAYPLFGTIGWQHYYLVPLLLLPGLATRMGVAWGILLSLLLALSAAHPTYLALQAVMGAHSDLAVVTLAFGWLGILALLIGPGARTGGLPPSAPENDHPTVPS